MSIRTNLLIGAGTAAITLVPTISQAQESAGLQLEEIVVTAQKVEQTVQKVSRAIDVVSAEDIKKIGAVSLDQVLNTVPGYALAGFQGQPSMRGIGNDLMDTSLSPPPVVVNVDGAGATGGGRGLGDSGLTGALFDIERVEIVRGPSGTMQGQNALGGAINVITRNPKLGELDFNAGLQVGNYKSRTYTAGASIPIGDTIALRVAYQNQSHDPYASTTCVNTIILGPPGTAPTCNAGDKFATYGWQDLRNARVKMLWQPSENFKTTLAASFTQDNAAGSNTDATLPGNPKWKDPWNLELASGPLIRPVHNKGPKSYRYSGEIVWDTKYVTVTALPTYTTSKPQTCTTTATCQTDSRVSAELRFQSAPGSKIEWQFGLYTDRFLLKNLGCGAPGGTCDSVSATDPTLNINQAAVLADSVGAGLVNPVFVSSNNSAGARDSKSAYASIVIPLTESTRLRAGARYAKDNSSSNPLGYIAGIGLPGNNINNALFTIYTSTTSSAVVASNQTYAQASAYAQNAVSTSGIAPAITCSNCTVTFRNGPYSFDGSSSPINWNAVWEWDSTDTSMMYVGLTTGYQAGGVQQNKIPSQTYPPEKVLQYSIGNKARFLDNTVQWNTEAYYYQFKDFHAQSNDYTGAVITVNGANYNVVDLTPYVGGARNVTPDPILTSAEGRNTLGSRPALVIIPHQMSIGLESTVTALVTPKDRVTANITLTQNRFGSYVTSGGKNLTGTQVANSPSVAGYITYQHTFNLFGGTLSPQATARYTGGTPVTNERYDGNTLIEAQFQDAYWKYDANIAWESNGGHWGANLYGNNLANTAENRGKPPFANPPSFVPFLQGTVSPPRTFGAGLNYKWL
ncbi:MAG: TonB-dependent receptor plug domain-containing protein [Steroidobacteraceae bacterium]